MVSFTRLCWDLALVFALCGRFQILMYFMDWSVVFSEIAFTHFTAVMTQGFSSSDQRGGTVHSWMSLPVPLQLPSFNLPSPVILNLHLAIDGLVMELCWQNYFCSIFCKFRLVVLFSVCRLFLSLSYPYTLVALRFNSESPNHRKYKHFMRISV